MTRFQWVTAGTIGVVLLLVLGLCWKGDQDKKSEGRIEQLEKQHVVDSTERVAAEQHTDSVIKSTKETAAGFSRVDTVWRTRSTTTINTIHDIARDTSMADSSKVVLIVQKADSLKAWGDSLSTHGARLTLRVAELEVAVADERLKASRERATMATEIKELKKLSRHWGLGGSLGYGLTRLNDGSMKTGPQLTLGVVYRR